MIRLSIVIVTWNSADCIRDCLVSIKPKPDWNVIVVDNASADRTTTIVKKEFPHVRLIENRTNQGYAHANNQGLTAVAAEYSLLLNPDTVVVNSAFEKMLDYMNANPQVGALGPKLLNPDGSIQPSCREFPSYQILLWEFSGLSRFFPHHRIFSRWRMGYFDHRHFAEVDQPMGACLLLRRSVLDQVGLLDEQFPMFMNDVDLCYRIKKAGLGIVFFPAASVIHYKGRSIYRVRSRMIVTSHRSFYHFFYKHRKPNLCQRLLVAGLLFLVTPWRMAIGSKWL